MDNFEEKLSITSDIFNNEDKSKKWASKAFSYMMKLYLNLYYCLIKYEDSLLIFQFEIL